MKMISTLLMTLMLFTSAENTSAMQIYQKIYKNLSRYKSLRTTVCKQLSSADYFRTIRNPYETTIIGGYTVVTTKSPTRCDKIPIANIYEYHEPDKLSLQANLGQFSLIVAGKPVEFTSAKHSWRGISMLSEFRSRSDKTLGRWRIIRDICVDYKGQFFVAIYIAPSDKIARQNLKTKYVTIKHINYISHNADCLIFYKSTKCKLKQAVNKSDFLSCKLTKANTFMMGGVIIKNYRKLTAGHNIPNALTDFQKRFTRRLPINSVIAVNQRWIKKNAPKFDSPEPWLNKLWSAQIYALQAYLAVDRTTQFIRIKQTDIKTFLMLLSDARWFADRRISIGTILCKISQPNSYYVVPYAKETLMCFPYPELAHLLAKYERKHHTSKTFSIHKSKITSYCEFIDYCRKFYADYDFDWIDRLRINQREGTIKFDFPCGVIDFVVTKLIGLQVRSDDHLKITPAKFISSWPYFIIDNLPYRDHNLTIVWQSNTHPKRYPNIPDGSNLYIDGRLIKHYKKLRSIECELR